MWPRTFCTSRSSGDKPVGNTPLQEHPGIICDGCEGKVIGRWYKCTECPDYDLGQSCESKGIHSEHNFMMYDTPVHPGYGFPFSWPKRPQCISGPVNHVAKDNPQLLRKRFCLMERIARRHRRTEIMLNVSRAARGTLKNKSQMTPLSHKWRRRLQC